MKKIFKSIDKVLVSSIGIILTVLLGLIYWLQPNPNKELPFWSIVVVFIVAYFVNIVIYVVVKYLSEEKTKTNIFPEIIHIDFSDNVLRVVQKKSPLFSQDCCVSFYYQDSDDDIQRLIGIGFVEVAETKAGFCQLFMLKRMNDPKLSDIFDNLIKNSSKARRALIVRPTITTDFLIREENNDEQRIQNY